MEKYYSQPTLSNFSPIVGNICRNDNLDSIDNVCKELKKTLFCLTNRQKYPNDKGLETYCMLNSLGRNRQWQSDLIDIMENNNYSSSEIVNEMNFVKLYETFH